MWAAPRRVRSLGLGAGGPGFQMAGNMELQRVSLPGSRESPVELRDPGCATLLAKPEHRQHWSPLFSARQSHPLPPAFLALGIMCLLLEGSKAVVF